MKQILTNLLVAYTLLCASFCLAYEEQTHRGLSQAAVEASVLKGDPTVLDSLGLEPFDAPNQFRNYRNDPGSIRELVQDGSAFEDEPGIRVRHHFYNPLTGRPANSCGTEYGSTSPDWPLEDRGQIDGVGPTQHQDDSFADTRQFFLDALTKPTKDERDTKWGRTFQGLGQVIHHLQDMTQPQHVRNDMHFAYSEQTLPCVGGKSLYEHYTNLDEPGDRIRTNLPYIGYDAVYGSGDPPYLQFPTQVLAHSGWARHRRLYQPRLCFCGDQL